MWDDIFDEEWGYDDPYMNWGGGSEGDGFVLPPELGGPDLGNPYLPYGMDGPSGEGGDAPGSTGYQFDWAAFAKDGDKYLDKLLSAKGAFPGRGTDLGFLGTVGRLLGLTDKDGNMGAGGLLPVLSILGALGGGVNASNKTADATAMVQAGAEKASQQATDLIGGARKNFDPYIQAGTGALGQLQAMVGQGIAGKFASPIGGLGAPAAIAGKAMPPIHGAMTLSQLAGRR